MKKKLSIFFPILIIGCSIFYYIIIRNNSFETGQIFILLLMYMPALAAIVAKLVVDHTIKGIGWRPCNIKTLLISYFLPLVSCILVYGITWVTGIGRYKYVMAFAMVLLNAVVGVLLSCISAVGEEIGWRGFLLTELRRTFDFPRTSLIIGLIWFVYHVPLIWFSTYNNGNIAVSTVCFFFMVMAMTTIANYLCIKTNSFWPSLMLHASHNLFVQGIFDKMTENGPYTQWVTSEFGIGLAAVYCSIAIYLIYRHKRDKKMVGENI